MRKNKVVELSAPDRARLEKFIGSGQALARHLKHAQVLLKLAEGWQNQKVAQAFDLSEKSVIAIRHRFLDEGVEAILKDKPRPGAPKRINGDVKALAIATACSPAPDGHNRWTLRMLSARLVELEAVEEISHESVRDILKKTK
jgi:transposase